MGVKVNNCGEFREGGKVMLVAGRGGGPAGPSLDLAPDGRPWTYHDESPRLAPRAWMRVRRLTAGQDAAGWLALVQRAQPDLGAWLASLPAWQLDDAFDAARLAPR